MAYKQNPGRGPMMKTGAGVPSALLQTDEKTGADKIITEKNPNLSESEKSLLSDRNMSADRWKSYGDFIKKGGKHSQDKINSEMKLQRASDSTFIVNNRVTRDGKYVDSSMAFEKPEDQEYRKSSLGKLHPQTTAKYTTNKFQRNKKTGNVEIK